MSNFITFLASKNRSTFITSVLTTLDGTAIQNIGQKMPTQIKRIYGISTIVGGTNFNGNANIVAGNEDNIYLTLFQSDIQVTRRIRLTELLFNADSPQKFLPVWLSGNIDTTVSFYDNPTLIVPGDINLYFWYIPFEEGEKLPKLRR